MTTLTFPLNEILSRLMFVKRIHMTELARQLNIPQPTLSRILSGTTSNPHIASLKPLADFFGVTIEQLKGIQPIPWLVNHLPDTTSLSHLPLISWEQAACWSKNSNQALTEKKIYTDANVSQDAYALLTEDTSMEPLFPKGTMIIIDRKKIPKDRSFVIVKLKNHPIVLFRQLLIDGPYQYLKPLNPDFNQFKMLLLDEGDTILGLLAQARLDYEQ